MPNISYVNSLTEKLQRNLNVLRIYNDYLHEKRLQWLSESYHIGDGYKRIHHYHIRKTAGTSLNAAFWGLAGLDLQSIGKKRRVLSNGLIFARHNPSLIEGGKYFFAHSHAPAHALTLPPKTFTITILRDPVDRILSHYRYLRWAQDNISQKDEPSADELQSEADELLGSTISDFIENLPKKDLYRQLYMFSPNYDVKEASEMICRCSAVFTTSTFTQDIEDLRNKLDIPILEKNERRFHKDVEVSDEEKSRVREILSKEYKLFEHLDNNYKRSKYALQNTC